MIYNAPGDPRFKEVEETVNFQLRFPSGAIANCTSSYGYYPTSHYPRDRNTGLAGDGSGDRVYRYCA